MATPQGGEVGLALAGEVRVSAADLLRHSRFGPGFEEQRADSALLEAGVQVDPGAGHQPVTARRHPGDLMVDSIGDLVVELAVHRQQVAGPVAEVVEEAALGHSSLVDEQVHAEAGEAGLLGKPKPSVDQLRPGLAAAALRPVSGCAGTLITIAC